LTDSPLPSAPLAAQRLGHLALLPFIAGAVLVWWAQGELKLSAAQALSAYAAVVVSFIGAIHWGLALPQRAPARGLLIWGVVPSIVAWSALLVHPAAGLWVHAAMLLVCYAVDRRVYPQQQAAAWLPLRLRLTVPATLCCVAGAIFS
jgi:hypothetical protein